MNAPTPTASPAITEEKATPEVLAHEPWCWSTRHGLCDCGVIELARKFPHRFAAALSQESK